MTSIRRLARASACAGALAALAGCAGCAGQGNAENGNVTVVAMRFAVAASSTDVTAACGLLAPHTLEALEETSGDCPSALAADAPTEPGSLRSVAVYGKDAIVHLSGDTLFLARFTDGWRVTAAACTARQDRPYDCKVEGN